VNLADVVLAYNTEATPDGPTTGRNDSRPHGTPNSLSVPPSRFTGWAAWNLGHQRAERAITHIYR
jgi:hypothetical protein